MAGPPLAGVVVDDRPANSRDRANMVVAGTFSAVGPGKAAAVWGPMNLLIYGVQKESLTCTAGANSGTVSAGTTQSVGDSVQSTLVPPGTTVATTSGGGALTFAFPTQMWGCLLSSAAAIQFPPGFLSNGNLPNGFPLSSLVGATLTDPNAYFGSGVTVLAVGPDSASLQLSSAPTTTPNLSGPVPIEFALTANCVQGGTDANATYVGSGTTLTGQTYVVERSPDGGATWVGCNIGGAGQLAKFIAPTNPISVAFGEPEAGSLYRVNCIAYASVTRVTPNYRFSTTGQAGTSLQTPAIT